MLESQPEKDRPLELSEVILDLSQKSEAGEALVAAANIEDWVKYLLEDHMRKLDAPRQDYTLD